MEDYRKPITFRPTDEDANALELLAVNNPVIKANTVDLIRMALQDYVINHGPDAQNSEAMRLYRLEKKMDIVLEHLGLTIEVAEKR